ncbi:zinc-dependent metalloproteinase lipoprotein, BF0631 family [Flexibacter flexilis DSM 6793]|uniref:Zinc-dependent metalloproteinase lipoprotein, BF0631 family n=1 Tax=Flexibacter flexilis DSM 6793 TaxID=927664 RepID=A0A1I1G3U2_9BACT|nr:PKD domain-containing protein [Flexibacter flexilis]SFC03860.1 zinc-dependent metalloproteinase lipoprotein, BF0631 family [Flexibacter flexilis DSM 6793]
MRKFFLFLGTIALMGFNSWGQTSRTTKQTFTSSNVGLRSQPAKSTSQVPAAIPTPPAHRTCASVEYNNRLAQQYPQQRGTNAQFEQWISQKMQEEQTKRLANNNNTNSTQATLIKIPVIVHVIHNGQAVGTAPNISAAQIQSQIDVLNEDFRKKVGTAGYNTNVVGADMEIEFVLALRNPSGTTLAEPGIHRYNGGAASYTEATLESTIKPATSWDPTKYLNLWTVNFGGADAQTLGYAQFPNSSGLAGLNANEGVSNTDGVVIGASYFGRVGSVSAPFNKGRTATHEIGHWLGLRHIWGDASCGTDYCNDTPVHAEENYAPTSNPNGCFTHPKSNTCGTADEMFENYMDYTNDACMNIFTNDQKSRMRTVMTNSPRRAELINSTVATPAGVPVPSFTSNTDGGCAPVTITYTNTSTGSPTAYSWSFPGGTPSTSTATNPTVTYSTAGVYDVTLTATNASGSASTTSSQYVFVGNPTTYTLPASFGFEVANMPVGWLIGNPDADTTWRRIGVGAFGTSSYSAYINNYEYDGVGKIDAIYTAKYSFANATSGQLKFDVAYAAYSATSADTLLLYYSTDCGNTFTQFYKKGGNTLSTNGGVYVTSSKFLPTASQWRTETITLPTILNGKSNVMFAFVNKCDYGNNLYLDNINISTTVPAIVANFGSSSPTVCMSNTVSYYSTSTGSPTAFSWTFAGGTPSTSTSATPVVTYNTPGTYSVTMTASNASGSNTITKTNYITVLGSAVSYPLPFSETFESTTFPPTADWKVANPDADSYTWVRSTAAGGFGTSTASAMVNNYNNSVTGRKDTLYTPYIDFTGANNPNFDFDIAYAPYNATSTDTLIVLYTVDCGQSYQQLFKKGGLELSSTNATYAGSGIFLPTATQWYTLTSVASYWVNKKVKFAFVNKTGFGNQLYIDNIKAYNGTLPTAPVANFTSNKDGGCAPLAVSFTDLSTNSPTSWLWSFPGGTPSSSTAQNPSVTYSTPGIYNVTLTATNAGGSNTIKQTSYIIVGSTTPTALPLSETFEGSTFPATNWDIYNPNADTTWRKTTAVGGYGNSTSSIFIRNASNTLVGSLDGYSFPTVNLTTITSPRLMFDVAYARYSANYSDTLIVAYSADCGVTYSVLWKKGGTELSSIGVDQTATFTPTATQWKTETVSLASIATLANVKLMMINKNGYGNNLYLDNILINSSAVAIAPNALFTSNKMGGCLGTQVQFTDQSTNTPTAWAWSFPGGTPASSTAQNPLVTYNTAGSYNVVLTVSNGAGSNTITKTGYITVFSNTTTSLPITADFESTTFPPSGWLLYNPNADTTWRRTTTASGFGTSTASAMINYFGYSGGTGRLDGIMSPKVMFSGLVNPEISFDVAYARYSASSSDSLYVMASTDCGATFSTLWKKGGTELSTNGGTDLMSSFTPTAAQWRRDVVALQALKNAGIVQLALIGRNAFGNKLYLDNINIAESNCTKPVATVTPSANSICTGNIAALVLSSTIPNTTYSWTVTTTGTVTGATAGSGAGIAQTLSGVGTVTYTVTPVAGTCYGLPVSKTITVNAIPTASASATATDVCAGSAIQLNATTVAGATYTWSGPNGFTSSLQNPTIANATTAASGNYALTVTVNSCTSPVSSFDIVVSAKPTASASSTTTIACAGTTLQLNAATVANASYAWTGPNGFSSTSQNPSIANATVAASGTYSLTVTTNGCTSTASTVAITVKPLPTVTASTTTASICAGGTIQLNGSTVANASYAWTGPNGFSSTSQNPSISNATTAAAGNYALTVTVNGCTSAVSSVDVMVNAKPTASASSTTTIACAGTTLQLNAATVANASYAWTGPNGFTSTSQNPSIANATVAASGTYSLTVTTNGCTSTASTVAITVKPLPTVTASTTTASICVGGTIQLNGSTVANASYAWTGPNGFSSTSQNPSISNVTTSAAGNYALTVSVNGCTSAVSSVDVVVNAKPTASASVTNASVCAGSTIQLNAATVVNASYAWTGPNGFTSTSQNPTITGATTAASGNYSLVVTTNGCTSAPSFVDIFVNTIPTASASAAATSVCVGSAIQLNAATVDNATYAWSGPNGFTSTEQNPLVATTTTAATGTYSLTVTTNSCASTASTVTVTVNAIPTAPTVTNTTTTVCQNAALTTLPTVAGTGLQWYADAALTQPITVANPAAPTASELVSTATAGEFTVFVTQNVAGCQSTASTYTVLVNPAPSSVADVAASVVCEGSPINLLATAVSGATYAWSGPNGFSSTQQNPTIAAATTAATGTYTLVVTLNGCTTTSTVNAAVNALPNVLVITQALCDGGTLKLSTEEVNGASYAWSGPNGFTSTDREPTVSPLTGANSGLYSVVVTLVGGCSYTSVNFQVIVSPIPTTPGITVSNDTLFATAGAATYTWLLSGDSVAITTNNFYVVPTTGSYSVIVTNTGGCASDTSATVLGTAIGVKSTLNKQISVYPNPSTGIYQVTATEGLAAGTVRMEVYDLNGRKLNTFSTESTAGRLQHTLDLREYAAGSYILKVTNAAGVGTYRLVKSE